jgi:hypothetical protein
MLALTPQARLTWYPGSIRPYASLWHTVLRVAALNCLHSGELPDWPTALSATGKKQRSIHPLHNAGAAVDTDALARALGESPAVFRWSHFGALAPWLRLVVMPGFRLCLPCLEGGYHSALFSLRLLNACPIHGTPLLAECRCGRPFKDLLSPADFARAGSCGCYALPYFAQATCRCPTMPATLTRAMEPAIDWLEQMSSLIKPASWREYARTGENPVWSSLLFDCSEAVGLTFPSCFAKPVQSTRRILTKENCTLVQQADRSTAAHAMERPRKSSYWADSPATWTYRAMSRHLRRHVVCCQPGLKERLFSAIAVPQNLPDMLRKNRFAVPALAEILWSLRMEPKAQERCWPYRNPWRSGMDPFHGQLAPASMVPSRADVPGAHRPLTAAAWHWIEYHAAAHVMVALWHDALTQAIGLASADHTNWNLSTDYGPNHCDWSVQVQQDGSLGFSGLSADRVRWSERARPDKPARRSVWLQAQQSRWLHLLDVCSGPCMSWTPREGWCVATASLPAGSTWKRHRLLGVSNARPQFWLFEDGARFTARLCSLRLQAFGATTGSAIEALRECLGAYLRVYGRRDLSDPPGDVCQN